MKPWRVQISIYRQLSTPSHYIPQFLSEGARGEDSSVSMAHSILCLSAVPANNKAKSDGVFLRGGHLTISNWNKIHQCISYKHKTVVMGNDFCSQPTWTKFQPVTWNKELCYPITNASDIQILSVLVVFQNFLAGFFLLDLENTTECSKLLCIFRKRGNGTSSIFSTGFNYLIEGKTIILHSLHTSQVPSVISIWAWGREKFVFLLLNVF